MSEVDDIANDRLDSPEEHSNRDDKNHSDDQGSQNEEPYYVERIIDKRTEDGQLYYKVVWQGYGEEDATWEPEENLYHLGELIEEFEAKLQKKKKNYLHDEDSSRNLKQSAQKRQKVSNKEGRPVDSNREGRTSVVEERKKLPTTGHLRYRDRPKEIVAIRAMTQPGIFLFRVRWEKRRTGEIPTESYISSEDFMRYNARFLLAFYNSKIKFKTVQKGDDIKLTDKKPPKKIWDLEGNLEREKPSVADQKEAKLLSHGSEKRVSFEERLEEEAKDKPVPEPEEEAESD